MPDLEPNKTVGATWRERLVLGFLVGGLFGFVGGVCWAGFVAGFSMASIVFALVAGPVAGLLFGSVCALCPKRFFTLLVWTFTNFPGA